MLRLDQVCGGYRRHPVLRGIDLEVDDGACVAVIGRNGVGKTTLVRAISGELPISGGTITLDGYDVAKLPMHRRVRLGIAHVPQGRGILSGLTVLDNLRIPVLASSLNDWRAQIDQVFTEFPMLRDSSDRRAGSLSGGQQQILAFARAMLTCPRILVLDEPSEGIQPSIVDQLGEALLDVNRQRGVAVLLVEQNIGFAAAVAPIAVVINKGVVAATVSTADLIGSRDLQREHLAL